MRLEEVKEVVCPECGTAIGQWIAHGTKILRATPGLSEEDIIRRAEEKNNRGSEWLLRTVAVAAVLAAFYEPVHAFLHEQWKFVAGVAVGTIPQTILWARDRWRWLKWFSWQ